MKFLKEQIIGTWKLVSWTFKNEKGETIHFLGEDCTGILMYDAHGYMNAQLMKGKRVPFASESFNGGTPNEAQAACNSYLAYFGKYYEKGPGEMVHTVEGSLFPNWVGHQEVRYGKIEGDRLILSTPPIPTGSSEIVFHIVWQRA